MKSKKLIQIFSLIALLSIGVFAQTQNQGEKKVEESTIVYTDRQAEKMPIAMRANVYCTGYITKREISANIEIVGANEEKDRHVFSMNDDVYLNAGSASGVKVGDMYSIVRPRGKVSSKWTKKSKLGVYVEELGSMEIVVVKRDVSVARIRNACGAIMMGDLVEPTVKRTSPLFSKRGPLDLYADSSGKASGNIVMARTGAELIGREMIVFIDLGREDNVQVGDYLTVYRPLGTGNLTTNIIKESSIDNKEEGFGSERYRGGNFSIQTSRKKGKNAGGTTVTTEDAKSRRPNGLRRVLGEMIILSVRESTATAVVVRAASEIHPGDKVEIK